MVFHFLYAGLSALELYHDSSASFLEMDKKQRLIPLLQTRQYLMIIFNSQRASFLFNTPHPFPKWALRKNPRSHPQMIMFITPQISTCYLPNQWIPIRSSLIKSPPLRSNRGAVNHSSGLMSLYCQIEMYMNCFSCFAAIQWYS